MYTIRLRFILGWLLVLAILLGACAPIPDPLPTEEVDPGDFRIEATSVVRQLEEAGIFQSFTEATGIPVRLSYFGDVELLLKVKAYTDNPPTNVDAMWLGSPIWAPGRLLQDKASIMRTYVVLGVNPEIADSLGWEAGSNITTKEVIDAINQKALNLAAPSSSQDDAGANFLFAVIASLSGKSYTTIEDLQNPDLRSGLKTVFSAVSGSASDAGKLRDRFIADRTSGNPQWNAFVLPESMAIATNISLVKQGKEPMRIFYVTDAISVQDFPLGWISGISEVKQQQFDKLVEYLRSDEVQARIQSNSYFRTGQLGMTIANPNKDVFNPNWGVITDQNFVPSPLPKDPVIAEALNLYQLVIKRPAETVYCLDYSPSMDGTGEQQRNAAMELLLDQSVAGTYLLQTGPADSTYTLPFSSHVLDENNVQGNEPAQLMTLYNWLLEPHRGDGTNIYGCAIRALEILAQSSRTDTLPAVILLTDGQHNTGESYNDLERFYKENALTIPVFSIMLADASEHDVGPIATLTNGLVCDGRHGVNSLVNCFRQFKGSN